MNKQPIRWGWSVGLVGLWAGIMCVIYLFWIGTDWQEAKAHEMDREAIADEEFRAELATMNRWVHECRGHIRSLTAATKLQQKQIDFLIEKLKGEVKGEIEFP